MGRRSTSSTKSGKFMNPTDQARKEARKRELKKNKKQRMMVRAAVLKMKDPKQIIRDMEKLDEMEFNPVQQPQLNEKVLKDKRKKLRETFERILRLYEKENPDTFKELRKLEADYEQKRAQLSQYCDAVKVPGRTPGRGRGAPARNADDHRVGNPSGARGAPGERRGRRVGSRTRSPRRGESGRPGIRTRDAPARARPTGPRVPSGRRAPDRHVARSPSFQPRGWVPASGDPGKRRGSVARARARESEVTGGAARRSASVPSSVRRGSTNREPRVGRPGDP
uniref:Wbp11/ELF5/Saf1 N-terminal domain-containing protein n=1 Tax=Ornithorhynchus anatinus TaxID=9258 RepID=A0A6I8NZZ9_ORNAN